ncbi:MAG: sialidase family protein [Pirellulales bacterium]
MKLEDRGLIFDATRQPAGERVAAFVSLYRLASGSLLCGFQLGPRKHDVASTIRFYRSTDGGADWHAMTARFETAVDGVPGSLSSGKVVELPSGKLLLYATWFDRSDPRRPLFDPVTQGILHSKQLLAESTSVSHDRCRQSLASRTWEKGQRPPSERFLRQIEGPALLQESARIPARLAAIVFGQSTAAEPADGDQMTVNDATVAVLQSLRKVGASTPADLE